MEGGNQSNIVQRHRAQLTREIMNGVHQFLHQTLGACNVALKIPGVMGRLSFQACQPQIDARQHLGNHIMQVPADLLALILLRGKKLA